MRFIVLTILAALSIHSSVGRSETVVVDGDARELSTLFLKRIVQKVGNRMRVLVVDSDGHESQIFISAGDAVETKRGVWKIRPGVYQAAI